MRISTEYSEQRGASALEASLAIVPVLLVCLLGVELVHAHQSKQLISLALQEAGRTASIAAADRDKINQTFAQALAPLFMPAGQATSALARLEATIARYQRLYALPLWQLELTDLTGQGLPPNGRRAMRLDLIYLHEPRHWWLRQALRQSTRWLSAQSDGLTAKARRQGLVAMPLSRRVVLHASETQLGANRVLHASATQPSSNRVLEGTERMSVQAPKARQALMQPRAASTPTAARNSATEPTHSAKNSTLGSWRQELDTYNLCGVLLCCAQ